MEVGYCKMSEREIADLKLKLKQKEKQVEYLKYKIKMQEHEIQELSILLYKKIRFMNEVKKRKR